VCASLLIPADSGPRNKEVRPRPSVVLADDNDLLLGRVVSLLAGECNIVGRVSNGRDLLELVNRFNPDVIVSDITMPDMDGLEVARQLHDVGATTKIIFLTVHDDSDYLRESFLVGATGYVIKDKLMSDLLQAVREVMAGRRFVSASPNLRL
jgi:DNA-binding NarL/FixJ family response regulator